MRSEIDQSTNATCSRLWQTPDLVCFGSVPNLTAGGTANTSETFISTDGGFTTVIPLPIFKA